MFKLVRKFFTEIPFDKTGKLKSSIKYQTGEFNYNYETDELGRISNWNTENLQLTQREKRLNHVAKTPGKLKEIMRDTWLEIALAVLPS